jgi:hypothetical protein
MIRTAIIATLLFATSPAWAQQYDCNLYFQLPGGSIWPGITDEQRPHDRQAAAKHGQRPPKPVLLSRTTALRTVDDRSPAFSHR